MCDILSTYCIKYCVYKKAHTFFAQFLNNAPTRPIYAQRPNRLHLTKKMLAPPALVVAPSDTYVFKLVRLDSTCVTPFIFKKALYRVCFR